MAGSFLLPSPNIVSAVPSPPPIHGVEARQPASPCPMARHEVPVPLFRAAFPRRCLAGMEEWPAPWRVPDNGGDRTAAVTGLRW